MEEQTVANQGISATVDGYFAMWNETDHARRQAVIAATWSDDAHYVDPLASVQGAEGCMPLWQACMSSFRDTSSA
jgi:hypothetical protein